MKYFTRQCIPQIKEIFFVFNSGEEKRRFKRDLNEFKFKNGFPGLNVSSFFAFNLVLTGKTA
jgi:hypothetical protein